MRVHHRTVTPCTSGWQGSWIKIETCAEIEALARRLAELCPEGDGSYLIGGKLAVKVTRDALAIRTTEPDVPVRSVKYYHYRKGGMTETMFSLKFSPDDDNPIRRFQLALSGVLGPPDNHTMFGFDEAVAFKFSDGTMTVGVGPKYDPW